MLSSKWLLITRLLAVSLLPVTILPASAINDASVSLNRRTFQTESTLANGFGAGHDDKVTPLPTNNQSDAIGIVTASTNHSRPKIDFVRQKRKDSKSKSKKKTGKNNNNKNSTDADDGDSGSERAITLPISLTISLAILVGSLQI